MKDAVVKWFNENKVAIIAGIIAGIGGVILANILTGGAVMAALPLLMQIVSAYFAAEAVYQGMKHFGGYLGAAWPGNLVEGATKLARALAVLAIELIFALLFGGKAAVRGMRTAARTVAKQGVRGAAKTGIRAAGTSLKQGARSTVKAARDLGRVGRDGAKALARNGKMAMQGVRKGFAKGAKTLDDLGQGLAKRLRFKKFRIRIEKRRFKLEGEINPWVLLASGEIKHIHANDPRLKGKKIGDNIEWDGQQAKLIGKRDVKVTSGKGIDNTGLTGSKDIKKLAATYEKIEELSGLVIGKRKAAFQADLTDEAFRATIGKHPDFVGIWKVLDDAGETRLAKRLDDLEVVNDYLNRNPKIDLNDVAEAIKSKGWATWLDEINGSISRYDQKFISYISQFDNVINNPTGRTKVWRVMRKDQSVADSIVAKSSTGLTKTKKPFTVEGHVKTGSRTETPYISSFTDKGKAIERAIADGNLKVVEIDLTKVQGKFFDLSVKEVREDLIKAVTTRNFAEASSEFLVVTDEIASEAYRVIDTAAEAAKSMRGKVDELIPPGLVQDTKGVHGYLLKEGSRYHQLRDKFMDPEWASTQRSIRSEYLQQSKELESTIDLMKQQGKSSEEIARYVVDQRNLQKVNARKFMSPEDVKVIEEGNIKKYGNAVGPSADDLFKKTGDWGKIIESSMRKDPEINVLLGLDGNADFVKAAQPDKVAKTVHVPNGAMSRKRIGHTFSKHGSHNTKQLLMQAKNSGLMQGQWVDDVAAESFIARNLDKTKNGAVTLELPKGLGRVVNPDGTFSPATHARLVPSGSGVKTAYPLIE